jgi:hypothetical protein
MYIATNEISINCDQALILQIKEPFKFILAENNQKFGYILAVKVQGLPQTPLYRMWEI